MSILVELLYTFGIPTAFAALYVFWKVYAEREAKAINDPQTPRTEATFDIFTAPYSWFSKRLGQGVPDVLLPSTVADDPQPGKLFGKVVWAAIPHARDKAHRELLKDSPWSWPVLDFALRLALFYPILFLLLDWAFFRSPELGGLPLLPENSPTWSRWLTVCGTSMMVISVFLSEMPADRFNKNLSTALFWTGLLAVGLSGPDAVTMTISLALAIAAGFAGAVTISFASAVALAFAGAVAIAAAISDQFESIVAGVAASGLIGGLTFGASVIAAILIAGLVFKATRQIIYVGSWQASCGLPAYLTMLIMALFAGLFLLTVFDRDNAPFVVLFFLFPILNGIFDWLSYGTTIALLRWGAQNWHVHKKGIALFAAALDMFLALCYFFALAVALIALLKIANSVHGNQLFDIAALLDQIEDDHWQVLWIVVMIGSTLVPTLIHLVIGALHILTLFPKHLFQKWIAQGFANDKGGETTHMRYVFPASAAALTLAPLVLLVFVVWWGLWINGGVLVDLYAQGLRFAATLLGLIPETIVTIEA